MTFSAEFDHHTAQIVQAANLGFVIATQMDAQLTQFHRQYLQQVPNLTYPSSKLVFHPDIQTQLYKYFFDESDNPHLPPPEYQRRVLKRLLAEIIKEVKDEDDEVSDDLMAHMGYLSSLPKEDESEAAIRPRVLSYFLPENPRKVIDTSTFDSTDDIRSEANRVLIRESPQLLAAGSNVGLRTWEACLRLAYYLCTSPARSTLQSANVLELGAGTGLLSLICAMYLDSRHVLATDGLEHVVDGIEGNIAENDGQTSLKQLKGMPLARVLDWTDTSELDETLSIDSSQIQFDHILGADITYHPELLDPLAALLSKLKHRNPESRILISATVRNEHTLKLWKQACSTHQLAIREINETEDQWKCPQYWLQTGLFHEQAFPIVIMDISRAETGSVV